MTKVLMVVFLFFSFSFSLWAKSMQDESSGFIFACMKLSTTKFGISYGIVQTTKGNETTYTFEATESSDPSISEKPKDSLVHTSYPVHKKLLVTPLVMSSTKDHILFFLDEKRKQNYGGSIYFYLEKGDENRSKFQIVYFDYRGIITDESTGKQIESYFNSGGFRTDYQCIFYD